MTNYRTAFSSFAVDDLGIAKKFYAETLELPVEELDMGVIQVKLNGTTVMIYPKEDYAPATFTVLNLAVDSVGAAVDDLTNRGITFERYENFNMDDKNIARDAGGPAIAWFKDPAGNIVSVLEA